MAALIPGPRFGLPVLAPEDQKPVKWKPRGEPYKVTMNYIPNPPPAPPLWLRVSGYTLMVGQEVLISFQGYDDIWTCLVAEIQEGDQGPEYRLIVKALQTPSE